MTNLIRTFFLFLGAVFALLLVAGGIFGYLMTGPAPIPDELEDVTASPTASERFDSKIEGIRQEIEEAQASGHNRDLLLIITEEEATSKAAQLAADGELPLEMNYIQIRFHDGMIQASAMADMIIDVQVFIQARVGVSDGKPDIAIESLYLGKLPIPKTLIDQVMVAVMTQLDEQLEESPVELRDVTVEDGLFTITGTTK